MIISLFHNEEIYSHSTSELLNMTGPKLLFNSLPKIDDISKERFIVIYLAVLHILWNGFILYMPGVDIYDLGAVIFSSAKYLQGQKNAL